MTQAPGRTALYRLYGTDDQLLYVGITKNLKTRWGQHAISQVWWPQVARKEERWYPTRDAALKAEENAIRRERPLHNRCLVAAGGRAMPPRPLEENRKAQAEVCRRLAEDLTNGAYEPGLRLSRSELSERYGAAITIISSALHELGRRGSLREHKNRYYVHDVT